MKNNYHSKNHSKYLIKMHFVFCVKYRKKILKLVFHFVMPLANTGEAFLKSFKSKKNGYTHKFPRFQKNKHCYNNR